MLAHHFLRVDTVSRERLKYLNAVAAGTLKWCSTVTVDGEWIGTVLKRRYAGEQRECGISKESTQRRSCNTVVFPREAARCINEVALSSNGIVA